jgi:peptidyl-prolyl isomerase E (cyclophilin E)
MAEISEKLVIYVGGLDESVNDKILYSAFLPFGEIKSIDIPIDFTTRSFFII